MFSVIVPTYNRPQSLQKLLESFEQQTLPKDEFEVIVVFSQNDSSEALLKTFKSSFSLIALSIQDNEFNGKSASLKRNQGAQRAKYPWLAFTDDDCIADPHWLANAQKIILEKKPAGIEGKTVIPPQKKMTFTAKGMTFLSQFGGYQTCNMLFNKDIFIQVGGFDNNLPFYLEDTDLAWSFLEKNHALIPAENVIITHPVPGPNVYRWVENAIRMRKTPYLAKKHPEMYKKTNFKALSQSTVFMSLVFFMVTLSSLITFSLTTFLLGLSVYLFLSCVYVLYLLRDCTYDSQELIKMLLFFPLIPPISLFQLMRGNIDQRSFIL